MSDPRNLILRCYGGTCATDDVATMALILGELEHGFWRVRKFSVGLFCLSKTDTFADYVVRLSLN